MIWTSRYEDPDGRVLTTSLGAYTLRLSIISDFADSHGEWESYGPNDFRQTIRLEAMAFDGANYGRYETIQHEHVWNDRDQAERIFVQYRDNAEAMMAMHVL